VYVLWRYNCSTYLLHICSSLSIRSIRRLLHMCAVCYLCIYLCIYDTHTCLPLYLLSYLVSACYTFWVNLHRYRLF
jgi:hypothetical protein